MCVACVPRTILWCSSANMFLFCTLVSTLLFGVFQTNTIPYLSVGTGRNTCWFIKRTKSKYLGRLLFMSRRVTHPGMRRFWNAISTLTNFKNIYFSWWWILKHKTLYWLWYDYYWTSTQFIILYVYYISKKDWESPSKCSLT